MTRRVALMLTALAQVGPIHAAQPARSLLIDTDVGSDDLLALAFLLSRPDLRIEAITVVNGLAHVGKGAENICRLLQLAGRQDVFVYAGATEPSSGHRTFPERWRRTSDDLPGVWLPFLQRKPEPQAAPDFLAHRLAKRSRPVSVLALGPLTNLAAAFQQTPALPGLDHLVIMGGALHVPGNLGDGGFFQTDNKTAEWNIFIDPLAASVVFGSRAKITLIPLDATAKVPINLAFLEEFQKRARTPLGRFAGEVLESDRPYIEAGYFQAWDPLAALALVQPGVVTTKSMRIEVLQSPPREVGRTVEAKGAERNVAVALDADGAEFKRVFFATFEAG